jgi:hypothetical protein
MVPAIGGLRLQTRFTDLFLAAERPSYKNKGFIVAAVPKLTEFWNWLNYELEKGFTDYADFANHAERNLWASVNCVLQTYWKVRWIRQWAERNLCNQSPYGTISGPLSIVNRIVFSQSGG